MKCIHSFLVRTNLKHFFMVIDVLRALKLFSGLEISTFYHSFHLLKIIFCCSPFFFLNGNLHQIRWLKVQVEKFCIYDQNVFSCASNSHLLFSSFKFSSWFNTDYIVIKRKISKQILGIWNRKLCWNISF